MNKRILGVAVGLVIVAVAALLGSYYRDSLTFRRNPSPAGRLSRGVVFFDRARANNDEYNVVNEYFKSPTCTIMDMDGKIVYDFPKGICHFFRDGSVLMMDMFNVSRFFGPDGREKWVATEKMHHDFDVSDDESQIFAITERREGDVKHHSIIGYSRKDGAIIFRWNSEEHFEDFATVGAKVELNPETGEYFHLNSVQVLRPNPQEEKDLAFQRGNILVSDFQNKMAFIIQRESGRVVWGEPFNGNVFGFHGEDYKASGAHSLKMLPNGHFFYMLNNYSYGFLEKKFTAIEEFDVAAKKTVWRYTADPAFEFNAPIWGSVVKLRQGHVLVTNSSSGSAFEVTAEGRLVWEWINPVNDGFGLAAPIYRVTRVPKKQLDPIIHVWKQLL